MKQPPINIDQLISSLSRVQEAIDNVQIRFQDDAYTAGFVNLNQTFSFEIKKHEPDNLLSTPRSRYGRSQLVYEIFGSAKIVVDNQEGKSAGYTKSERCGDIYTIRMVKEKDTKGMPMWAIYEGYPLSPTLETISGGEINLLGKTHYTLKAKNIAYNRGDIICGWLKRLGW